MGIPEPTTPAGAEGLAALTADPSHAVVALDFDGTLSPIVPDPDQARAHPGALPVLVRLAPLVGTVAIVTGRPAGVAVRYGGFAGVRGLENLVVLGHYGAERWDAVSGEVRAPRVHPGVAAVRAELPGHLDRFGAWHGTWIEDKGRAVAVHTRRTEDPDTALDQLRSPLAELAARHGLVVEPGRMVLELRPPGVDKGAALSELLREREARSVLYAGDDLADPCPTARPHWWTGGALQGPAAAEGASGDLSNGRLGRGGTRWANGCPIAWQGFPTLKGTGTLPWTSARPFSSPPVSTAR
jgi:trehalose 6-phosphate phosphatase